MSIKLKLLLSYIAMTFIPVVLFALLVSGIGALFFYDQAGTGHGMPSFVKLANERDELIAGVKFMAQTEPDRFADSHFLQVTDEALNRLHAGLVVKREEQVIYASPLVDSPELADQLREVQAGENRSPWGKKFSGHYKASAYDVTFSDHSKGRLYVLSDVNVMVEGAKTFFPLMLLAMLAVIGLTNGILTFLVSRNLIKPMNTLKHAAEQIKEGNLDAAVKLKRKDEIGALGAAFEEMRVRLKESIHLQLQYEENRKELVANISHDLKTPITGIKACIEGIRDGIADTGEKRDKYMGMIAKKTEEMDRLIDELLLFSKLDLKRLPFQLEPIDLAAYLRDCIEELRLDPRLEGTSIAYAAAHDRPVTVIADGEKLRRVIMNIIDNSLKYMDKEQKAIQVSLLDGREEATVCIQDNGPGVEHAALPHIFDRFYRAEPSRNTATGGSGIGLAIVRQIVEGQGGRVWAESLAGEGTSIYFTLPKTKHGGDGV